MLTMSNNEYSLFTNTNYKLVVNQLITCQHNANNADNHSAKS